MVSFFNRTIFLFDEGRSGHLFLITNYIYFGKASAAIYFERYSYCLRRPLTVIKFFLGYCVFLDRALAVIHSFKGIELISPYQLQLSIHTFFCKGRIAAMSSCKFTVPFRKAVAVMRYQSNQPYQLQPFIFPMILSLFQEKTWNDPFCQRYCVYF